MNTREMIEIIIRQRGNCDGLDCQSGCPMATIEGECAINFLTSEGESIWDKEKCIVACHMYKNIPGHDVALISESLFDVSL